jgi:hypothetical protein
MARAVLPIALVVGVAFAPVCARAESRLSLKSISVDRAVIGRRLRPQERDGARL